MDTVVYRCRLCLNRTSKKVDIFKHDFPKMIELLAGIKVDPTDHFPKESCLDCAKDVKFCMSVRKQILQSYKRLVQEIIDNKDSGSDATTKLETPLEAKNIIPETTPEKKIATRRSPRKREQTPDSTSEEDDGNFSEYSDRGDDTAYEDPAEETEKDTIESDTVNENFAEQITLIHEVEEKSEHASNHLSEETDIKADDDSLCNEEKLKTEETIEQAVNASLSPERLLRKRNMIAASNRILKQEGDRRYANIVFIRKSAKNNVKQQQPTQKPKQKKEQSENLNVIWKNGKKYAACEICKKEVKLHYMKHHMTTHFPEHFSCDVCGVTTRNLRGLRYHKLYWHSSKLDYICDKCGKKYRSKHALDLHNKKEHGGIRDLECNICGKKFFQKMHLKRHIDGIHKKLRPHKCEYCGKDFTKRTHLVTHWRTHTNETPYGCDMCAERFKLKLSLKNHLRRAHNYEEKERVFCDVCNRGFASEQGLRAHINSRVHEGEKCQYCSESFTPEYLKVHLREVHMHVDFF